MARYFNGIDQTGTATLNVTGKPITIAAHFRADDYNVPGYTPAIVDFKILSTYQMGLGLPRQGIGASRRIGFGFWAGGTMVSGIYDPTDTPITKGEWYTAVGMLDGTPTTWDAWTVWCSNGGYGTALPPPLGFEPEGPLYIAGSIPSDTQLEGAVAWVSVWDAELTDSEAWSICDGYSPTQVRRKNLVHYYPFGYPYPNHDKDVISGGEMTGVGSPTWSDSPSGLIVPGQPQFTRQPNRTRRQGIHSGGKSRLTSGGILTGGAL